MSNDEKRLLKIYRDRLNDRSRYKGKRRRAVEGHPKSFSSLLEGYFKGDGEALKKIEENRALLAWPDIVGKAAASVSFPIKIRGGKLTVKVLDPIWMQQLSFLKLELLKKYRTGFPKLRLTDIYFTSGHTRRI